MYNDYRYIIDKHLCVNVTIYFVRRNNKNTVRYV